jgi:hypothetical protein
MSKPLAPVDLQAWLRMQATAQDEAA